MSDRMIIAERTLKSILKAEKLCVWPVNSLSTVYKLGLLLGVTLSWPGDKETIKREITIVRTKTEQVAEENGLEANYDEPIMVAGEALVIFCGFKTPFSVAALREAQEQNKPVWRVCEEDLELIELAKS